jgi:hypothetical protein
VAGHNYTMTTTRFAPRHARPGTDQHLGDFAGVDPTHVLLDRDPAWARPVLVLDDGGAVVYDVVGLNPVTREFITEPSYLTTVARVLAEDGCEGLVTFNEASSLELGVTGTDDQVYQY